MPNNPIAVPLANTNMPWKGKTPRQAEHAYCVKAHICDRCRSKWVEANRIYCEPCASAITMASAKRHRENGKNPARKKDKNPRMGELVIAPVSVNGKISWAVEINSDIGKLIRIRGFESFAVRRVPVGGGPAEVVVFHDDQIKNEVAAARKSIALVAPIARKKKLLAI